MSQKSFTHSIAKASLSCLLLATLMFFLSLPAKAHSLENTDPIRVELYPNPANEVLAIELSQEGSVDFQVYSIIGNKLKMQPVKTGQFQYRLNVSNLASGYYLLMVTGATGTAQTVKFEKK